MADRLATLGDVATASINQIGRVVNIIGVITAAMSCLSLFNTAVIKLDLLSFAGILIQYYDGFWSYWLGGLTPYIEHWFQPLLDVVVRGWLGLLGWNFHLFPHWKHISVLLWLYVGVDVVNACRASWPLHWFTAAFRSLWGALVALAAGAVAGSFSAEDPSLAPWIVASACGGVVLYRLGWAVEFVVNRAIENWRYSEHWDLKQDLIDKLGIALVFLVIGVGLVVLSHALRQSAWLAFLPNPGLTVLPLLVIVLGLYHIGAAAMNAGPRRWEGERLWQSFLRQGNFTLGSRIMVAVISALVALLISAGPWLNSNAATSLTWPLRTTNFDEIDFVDCGASDSTIVVAEPLERGAFKHLSTGGGGASHCAILRVAGSCGAAAFRRESIPAPALLGDRHRRILASFACHGYSGQRPFLGSTRSAAGARS